MMQVSLSFRIGIKSKLAIKQISNKVEWKIGSFDLAFSYIFELFSENLFVSNTIKIKSIKIKS